MGFSILDLI